MRRAPWTFGQVAFVGIIVSIMFRLVVQLTRLAESINAPASPLSQSGIDRDRSSKKHHNVASIIGVASVIAVTSSVIVASHQVAIISDQLELAITTVEEGRKLEDLRFIGRVAVELDEATSEIRISNYSDLPIVSASVWTLGIADLPSGYGRLDTVRALLTGIGACRTIIIPIETLSSAAMYLHEQEPPPAISEPYITFQAPSGLWYTRSKTIVYDASSAKTEDPVEAASTSSSDQILGDTVEESVYLDDFRTIESILPIGPAGLVTESATGGVELVPNICESP